MNKGLKLILTREEMIRSIYKVVEDEKSIMRSDSVNRYEDILGKLLSKTVVEMSCRCIEDGGMTLTEHVNIIANSDQAQQRGGITLLSFVLTECENVNMVIKGSKDDNDQVRADILASASVMYKLLQRLTKMLLHNKVGEDDQSIIDALLETLELNSLACIEKATTIKRKEAEKKMKMNLI